MSRLPTLETRVARELGRPEPAVTAVLVDAIRRRFGDAVVAILFYGSCRRTGDMTGLLDVYVLHDGHRRFHGRWMPALLNWLLPPDVVQISFVHDGSPVAAKVAIISRRQFARRMRPASFDTTIWTRFCQPVSLLYASDRAIERWVSVTIAQGIRTAVYWATRLGPPGAGCASLWRALFARTYRLELRPESRDRSSMVHETDAAWFDEIMTLVRAEASSPTPRLIWLPRRILGKPLNLARLVKAAFTFAGGADYLTAKLNRHTGVALTPGPWQRRHPLLSAFALIWNHRRALRRNRPGALPLDPAQGQP